MGSRSLAMRNRTVNQYIGHLGSKVDNLVNSICENRQSMHRSSDPKKVELEYVQSPHKKSVQKRINYIDDEVMLEET